MKTSCAKDALEKEIVAGDDVQLYEEKGAGQMCNIAGYVGNKRAAPILIEMMKKQEGYAGGYYSGIATISEGKLHYAKVVGDVERLLQETDAINLPGKIGLMHSRSKSGGGQSWAHPFISDGGKLAYAANGSFGVFGTDECRQEAAETVASLVDQGYVFETKLPELKNYIPLGDGNYAHMSEAMAHLIASMLSKGMQHDQAMAEAFRTMPAEITGLMLHADIPDRIVAARINMPMMVGRGEGETYLATTAMAFPNHIANEFIFPLPAASTSEIFADEISISRHRPDAKAVADIPVKLWSELYARLEEFLSGKEREPKRLSELIDQAKQLLPGRKIYQTDFAVYEVLRSFHNEQRLVRLRHVVSGAQEGLNAPVIRMHLE